MTARSFREPGQPPPAGKPEIPLPPLATRPPRRDVVARLVARAIAAAEAKGTEAGRDRP